MHLASLLLPLLTCATFVASAPVPFGALVMPGTDYQNRAVTASLTPQQRTMLDHAFTTANEIIVGLNHVYRLADEAQQAMAAKRAPTADGTAARKLFVDAFGEKTWMNAERPLEMLQILEGLKTHALRVFPLNPADAWAKKKTYKPDSLEAFYASTPKYPLKDRKGNLTPGHDAILFGNLFWGDFTSRTNPVGTPSPSQELLERIPARRAQILIHEAIHILTHKTDSIELTAAGCKVLRTYETQAAGSTIRKGYFEARNPTTQMFKDATSISGVDAQYKDTQAKCDTLYFNPDSWSLLASLWWRGGKIGPQPGLFAQIKDWIKKRNCTGGSCSLV